jgi:ATP-dependent helicase/nuclease subunit B
LEEETLVRIMSETTSQFGIDFRGELMISTARNRYLLGRIATILGHVARTHQEMEKLGDFRLGWTNVRFAAQPDALPPISVRTPKGNQIQLEGKIDRIDRAEDGTVCAIDYRLSAGPWAAYEAYHGLSLHLFTMILLLESGGYGLTDEPIKAGGAIHLPLLRKVKRGDPIDAPWPDESEFHLASAPRGILALEAARKFDPETSQGASRVVQYYINKEGGIGFAGKSDAVENESFSLMLDHVKGLIVELADRIIQGEIAVRPYKAGKATPCSRCPFREVCRFEPRAGGYVHLEMLNRGELWDRLSEKGRK